jgi:hypothetical protein
VLVGGARKRVGRPLGLLHDRSGLFTAARACLRLSLASLRESRPIGSPSPAIPEKTRPRAHAIGRLCLAVDRPGLVQARGLARSPRFLTESRDSIANKSALSSSRLMLGRSLGTSGEMSPIPPAVEGC